MIYDKMISGVKEGGGKINACPLNISKLSFISVWVRIYFSESMELNTEPADLKIESADFLSLVMWTVQLSSVTVYWGHMRLNTKSNDVKPQALYFQKKNLSHLVIQKGFKVKKNSSGNFCISRWETAF